MTWYPWIRIDRALRSGSTLSSATGLKDSPPAPRLVPPTTSHIPTATSRWARPRPTATSAVLRGFAHDACLRSSRVPHTPRSTSTERWLVGPGAAGTLPDVAQLRRELRAEVANVRGLLSGNVAQTPELSEATRGAADVSGVRRGGRIGYRFTGRGTYADVLPGKLSTLVVTPAGFDAACTLTVRDSVKVA